MSKKLIEEWSVNMPWGELAVVSWGHATNPPILLVHGYMDSAATFIPLVDELPDSYFYVGIDMPGHGKSKPFPPGTLISQLHMVEVIRRIVVHMKWKNFVYMAHSMGTVIGLFYNHLYPGKITKTVYLDPGPPISMYYYVHYKPSLWFNYLYNEYYDNYERWTSDKLKLYTYDDAVRLVVRNRNLSEEEAEAVLSRSLVQAGDNKFTFSWEPRMKKIASVTISEETFFTIIATNTTPTLVINASENNSHEPGKSFAANILEKIQLLPNFNIVKVRGGHDVHITNPDVVAAHISDFLDQKFSNKCSLLKCKL